MLGAAELRYTRRAAGTLEAEARLDPGIDSEALVRDFTAAGRGALAVAVVIRDPGGETVFEGTFHYAMRRRRQ